MSEDSERKPAKEKGKSVRVSPLALQILKDVIDGLGTGQNCHGQSEHGGRASIVFSLQRKGFLDWNLNITEAGKELVKKRWKK